MDSFPAVQKTKRLPRVTTNGTAPTTGNDGQSIGSGYRGPGGSCVIVDQKGQISAVTISERRKLGKVIVLCPFTEGLPEGLAELLGPTRQYLESEREDEWAVRHNDEIWHGADWCSDATGFYE
jgi:hypothetical protein